MKIVTQDNRKGINMMNSYFFKKEKVVEILNEIQKKLNDKSNVLEKAFDIDYKKWEVKIEIEQLIKIVEKVKKQEYLPKFSKQEIIDGIGKIALVNTTNPYIIFNFVLSCICTNNKACIILENKFIATNIAIIECVKKVLEDLKYESNLVEYKEVLKKEEIIQNQEEYDLIYYVGNKEEYLNFIKRIHIDSKFENFGEIYVYVDNKEVFKDKLFEIDMLAYKNELKVYYYDTNLENSVNLINKGNNINKISIIFTDNIENAYEFVKKIKAEKIYINEKPEAYSMYNINNNNLIFKKVIVLKK